ncbi:MAG: heavy metal sensor histidine kinase [Planctomycetota bacterium]|nr:heavy metal sensor histidine kinase [Planctomycetota bacterium]
MSSKNAAADLTPPVPPNARRPWSLATRLTFWYAASAFLLLLLGTSALYFAMIEHFSATNSSLLRARIHEIEDILHDHKADTTRLSRVLGIDPQSERGTLVLIRVLIADGPVLAETPGMAQTAPQSMFSYAHPGAGTISVDSASGRPFRVMVSEIPATATDDNAYQVQFAIDDTLNRGVLAEYRKQLWVVLIVGLVCCAAVGYWIAHHGLRPIEQMAAAVRSVRSTTLHRRIAPAGFPAELAALANNFNKMLQGLEDAFSRLSRYSADIAHELRSPIHNLRGEAEVVLGRPRSPEEYREVLGSCLEECVRLSSLIDGLLFLARADNPEMQIRREYLKIAHELAVLREFYAAPAAEANISLELEADSTSAANLDRNLFQRAVGNLIENAIAYSNPGGTIKLAAHAKNGLLRIDVRDSGRGIPPEHLPHVFDRFYRVDGTRSKKTGGIGLGLAIVKTIASLHGGDVRIASRVGVGTRITILFPASAPTPLPSTRSAKP